MKFVCQQEALARGIGIVGRNVSTKSTLPILGNILLSAEGGQVKLSATNLEVSVNCFIEAEVEHQGTTTVPARLLSEFVNSLPQQQLAATLAEERQSLHLSCERIEANIKGLHPKDFPLIPAVPESPITEIPASVLRSMINLVEFAASADDSRPVFTGVLVNFSSSRLDMAAADGFRLAVCHEQLESNLSEPVSIIVPARGLSELARILADQSGEADQTVSISVTSQRNQALFKAGNVELIARLIDGQFPNYEQIIPQKYNVRAEVRREELLNRIRIASFFARDNANIVRLDFSPGPDLGSITIKATGDQSGDNTSVIEAKVDEKVPDEDHEIAFNARYLGQVLERLEGASVTFEITTRSAPGVIRSVDKGDDYVHVVMPMALTRYSD